MQNETASLLVPFDTLLHSSISVANIRKKTSFFMYAILSEAPLSHYSPFINDFGCTRSIAFFTGYKMVYTRYLDFLGQNFPRVNTNENDWFFPIPIS